MSFNIQTAVVTGASSGIGKAITLELVSNGVYVYGISRSDPEVSSNNFQWLKCDLLKLDEYESIVNQINQAKIDVLVNNAGGVYTHPAHEFDSGLFDKTFRLNFHAPVQLTSYLLPKLSGSLVVTVSSDVSVVPVPDFSTYASSKAALNIYFKTLAKEQKHVNFITIMPGMVDTPLLRRLLKHSGFDSWNSILGVDHIVGVFARLIEEHDSLGSGTGVFITNSSMSSELEENLSNDYIYNVETEVLQKVTHG